MKQLLFATSNKSKLEQFQYVADSCGLKVKIVSVYDKFPDVEPYGEEYRTQYEIVENGAYEVWGQIREPFVLEDTIMEVPSLDGLPGIHSNAYMKEKGLESLIAEMQDKQDCSATITSIVGYYDGKLLVSSKNVVRGQVARKLNHKDGKPAWVGPSFHPFGGGFNAAFTLDTTGKTLADHSASEGIEYGYREPNFKALLHYLV